MKFLPYRFGKSRSSTAKFVGILRISEYFARLDHMRLRLIEFPHLEHDQVRTDGTLILTIFRPLVARF